MSVSVHTQEAKSEQGVIGGPPVEEAAGRSHGSRLDTGYYSYALTLPGLFLFAGVQ